MGVINIMGASQMREELHQFINRADERILNLIYGMMKADRGQEDFSLSDSHKKKLDERLKAHQENPTEGSTWDEVKSRILKK